MQHKSLWLLLYVVKEALRFQFCKEAAFSFKDFPQSCVLLNDFLDMKFDQFKHNVYLLRCICETLLQIKNYIKTKNYDAYVLACLFSVLAPGGRRSQRRLITCCELNCTQESNSCCGIKSPSNSKLIYKVLNNKYYGFMCEEHKQDDTEARRIVHNFCNASSEDEVDSFLFFMYFSTLAVCNGKVSILHESRLYRSPTPLLINIISDDFPMLYSEGIQLLRNVISSSECEPKPLNINKKIKEKINLTIIDDKNELRFSVLKIIFGYTELSKKAANLINKFGNFATDKRITSSVLSIYHNDKLKKYIGSSKVKQSKLTNFLILNINNITNTVILKNDEFKKYLEFINTFNGEDVLLAYSNQISFDDIYEMIGDDFFQNLRTPHFSQKKNRLNLFFTVAIFHALFSKFEDNEKNCKELIYKNNQIASLVKYFAWRISISHVNFFENIKVYKKKIIDEVLQKRVRFITRREIFVC